MSDTSTVRDEHGELIAALQQRVADLEAKGRPLRRFARVAVVVAALAAFTVSVAGATTTPPDTSQAAFTPLATAHKVFSGSLAANKTSPLEVVRGGTSTVPTNAGAVQLSITIKATKSGILRVQSDNFQQKPVIYSVGTLTGAIVDSEVGAGDKLSFRNDGSASVTVTVTITGYTQQIPWTDIYGDPASGIVYATRGTTSDVTHAGGVVASLSLPAGLYVVNWSAFVSNDNLSLCQLNTPGGDGGATKSSTAPDSLSLAAVVLLQLPATITMTCQAGSLTTADAILGSQMLVAVPERSAVGTQ